MQTKLSTNQFVTFQRDINNERQQRSKSNLIFFRFSQIISALNVNEDAIRIFFFCIEYTSPEWD
jgi:hypothetical protein